MSDMEGMNEDQMKDMIRMAKMTATSLVYREITEALLDCMGLAIEHFGVETVVACLKTKKSTHSKKWNENVFKSMLSAGNYKFVVADDAFSKNLEKGVV